MSVLPVVVPTFAVTLFGSCVLLAFGVAGARDSFSSFLIFPATFSGADFLRLRVGIPPSGSGIDARDTLFRSVQKGRSETKLQSTISYSGARFWRHDLFFVALKGFVSRSFWKHLDFLHIKCVVYTASLIIVFLMLPQVIVGIISICLSIEPKSSDQNHILHYHPIYLIIRWTVIKQPALG